MRRLFWSCTVGVALLSGGYAGLQYGLAGRCVEAVIDLGVTQKSTTPSLAACASVKPTAVDVAPVSVVSEPVALESHGRPTATIVIQEDVDLVDAVAQSAEPPLLPESDEATPLALTSAPPDMPYCDDAATPPAMPYAQKGDGPPLKPIQQVGLLDFTEESERSKPGRMAECREDDHMNQQYPGAPFVDGPRPKEATRKVAPPFQRPSPILPVTPDWDQFTPPSAPKKGNAPEILPENPSQI